VLILEQARYTVARLGDSSARCDEMAGRGRKSRLPWIKSHSDPRFPCGEVHRVAIMGLYEHWIVPRLLDLAMRNRLLHPTIASRRSTRREGWFLRSASGLG